MSLPQENDYFLWRALDLPEEERIDYTLELGYEIHSTRGIESVDKETSKTALQYRYVELWKDGTQIYTDEKEDYAGNEERCAIDHKTPAQLFSHVAAYLNNNEIPEKITWIRRNFTPTPTEIPPWRRYNKTPSKNIPTRKYFKHGETAATPEEIENIIRYADNIGNGERFKEECNGYLLYDAESDEWGCWKINHYEKPTNEIQLSQNYVARTIYAEYEEVNNLYVEEKNKEANTGQSILPLPRLKKAAAQLMKLSENSTREKDLSNMTERAKGLMGIKRDKEFMKNATKYISCKNGIFNTTTGEFIENWDLEEVEKIKPEYPFNYVDCVYTPWQTSTKFKEHLETIFYDNTSEPFSEDEEEDERIRKERQKQLSDYFLKITAYMLYPGNPERLLLYWCGEGKNGKSATEAVLKRIFKGLYANCNIQDMYVAESGIPRPSIANALDKRIAFFSEAEDDNDERRGGMLSGKMIKIITGEESTDEFRQCHKNTEENYICCLPILIVNSMTQFDKGLEMSLMDRILVIKFNHRFTNEEIKPNYHEELFKEKDAIFSMIIDSYIELMKDDTKQPNEPRTPKMPDAPEFVKMEQKSTQADYPYGEFVKTCIVKNPNPELKINRVTPKMLEISYICWCERHEHVCDLKPGYGTSIERGLTKREIIKLNNAMAVYGWEIRKSNGDRYFSGCKIEAVN